MKKTIKKVTVKDIAKTLNVSGSTVSRALKNNPEISQKTKEIVWLTAKKMGYLPNIPIYMQESKKKTILFLLDNLLDKSVSDILTTAQTFLQEKGYITIIKLYQKNQSLDKYGFTFLKDINISGVINLMTTQKSIVTINQYILEQNIPILVANRFIADTQVPCVIPDVYNGAFLASEHMIKRGAKSLAILINDNDSSYYSDIIRGFESSITSNIDISYEVIKYDSTLKHLPFSFQKLINNVIAFDGILICDSYIAQKLYFYLLSKGNNVPRKMMLVSYGNDIVNDLIYTKKITTIDYSLSSIGKNAAIAIDTIINGNLLEEKLIIEPVKLQIRSSTIQF